jgi:hypothetical protein
MDIDAEFYGPEVAISLNANARSDLCYFPLPPREEANTIKIRPLLP